MMLLFLILATSRWGFSELWGGGVPTLDIHHSRSRLCRLLLHMLIEISLPSPPPIQCPASPDIFFCPASAQYHPPTRASPISVPAYQENPVTLPYLTCYHQIPTLPFLPRPHHSCNNWMYKSNPLNSNFDDFLFDGNERLITIWQIYHINDDIVEGLNNGSIIGIYTNWI